MTIIETIHELLNLLIRQPTHIAAFGHILKNQALGSSNSISADKHCTHPKMAPFSSLGAYYPTTNRKPVICRLRKNVNRISSVLSMSYEKVKNCATDSMNGAYVPRIGNVFLRLAMT